ncbi:MAG: L-ribulose-5-phosphate 4-epimerase [Oscillospiraceae bacterium]|nr:L-ribulose-5-phosphate 4-epimerase [Oscillospiraceae bacterium]
MLEELKQRVCEANLSLVKNGLVVLTWGNVSALSPDGKYVVIKPSGVSYDVMAPEHMVVTDRAGNIVEGELRPSTDLATHLEIYDAFPGVGGVVHTHSRYAVAMAQAEIDLPCYGTTHADYFFGSVPCTRHLTSEEIHESYERSTGQVIAETFRERGIDPAAVPAVLVRKHGPFTWGPTPEKAVENAVVLDECAHMALLTRQFNPAAESAPQAILDKHYYRKHGAGAYYGQK